MEQYSSKQSSISQPSVDSTDNLCKAYEIKALAEYIVQGTLKRAIKKAQKKSSELLIEEREQVCVPNIVWPNNKEFTIAEGEGKIKEFIKTWKIDQKWLFCIDFTFEQSDGISNYYHYEVKWSISTDEYPIPQATVSVFFTIEVSKAQSESCPVNVRYQFETDPYIHRPGETMFREEWISDILERKITFFRSLSF